MSFKRTSLCLGFLAVAFTARTASAATTCKVDSECSKGFICQLVPTAEPSPPPTPACKPGGDCPVTVTDPATPTSGGAKVAPPAPTTGYCSEGPCKVDGDCGAGMVCHTQTFKGYCDGGVTPAIACAPDSNCALPKPTEVCTPDKTIAQCMFKWELPCSTDTECGAGFQCQPTVSMTCSGGSGGGTPGSTGGGTASGGSGSTGSGNGASPATSPAADLLPPKDTCTTSAPSFPGWCQPKAKTCTTDAECPTSWTCEASATGNVSTPGSGPSATSTDAPTLVPPGTGAPIPPADPAVKACVSPFGTYDARDGNTTAGGTKGDDTPSTPGTTPTTPTPTTTTTGHEGPGAGGGTPPTSPESGSTSLASNGGCAVGGGAGGSPLALLGLAALGLLVVRRRR